MVSAQVFDARPAETAATPLVSPTTSTCLVRFGSVPSPNRPAFLPQHLRPPAVVRAHVCSRPAETAVAVAAEGGCAGVGVGDGEEVGVGVGVGVGDGAGVGVGVGVGDGVGVGTTPANPTTSTGVVRNEVVPSPS